MKKILYTSCLLAIFGLSGCKDENVAKDPATAPVAPVAVVEKTPEQLAAEEAELTRKEIEEVTKIINEKHPDISSSIFSLNRVKTEGSHLFEVITNVGVFYTNKEVDYILIGSLFLKNHNTGGVENITERQEVVDAVRAAVNKSDIELTSNGFEYFNSLPLKDSFKKVYGTGENVIALFEDPECGYCHQFAINLSEFGNDLNLTVYSFPFVLESIHPNAIEKVEKIVCAQNSSEAWHDWMLTIANAKIQNNDVNLEEVWDSWSAVNAPDGTCPKSQIVQLWQLAAKELGFNSTPTIVFENGSVLEGALNKDAMQSMLNEVNRQKQQYNQNHNQTANQTASEVTQ